MYNFKQDVDMGVFLAEAEDILYKHWQELALNKDKVYLKPDVQRYIDLQTNNILKNVVVYKDDKVVGYSITLINPALHYSDHLFAYVDVIYVDPDYRHSTIGARLLIETENVAKKHGAHVILHHAKPYVPMIIKPLEKLNYQLYELMYGKYIGE
jgi:ribosomal protein S18 acetylase RimI-like enzyme